jgi:hypothetical protein
VIRHVSGVLNVLGTDYRYQSQPLSDVIFRNNLVVDLSAANWGGAGQLILTSGGRNLTLDHNTVFTDGTSVVYADGAPVYGFTFTNNIIPDNSWAVMGAGSSEGNGTLNTFFPNGTFLRNVIIGGQTSLYPTGNYFPATVSGVGFIDATGNYRLSSSSPHSASATDGTAIGVNARPQYGGRHELLTFRSQKSEFRSQKLEARSPEPEADRPPPSAHRLPCMSGAVRGDVAIDAAADEGTWHMEEWRQRRERRQHPGDGAEAVEPGGDAAIRAMTCIASAHACQSRPPRGGQRVPFGVDIGEVEHVLAIEAPQPRHAAGAQAAPAVEEHLEVQRPRQAWPSPDGRHILAVYLDDGWRAGAELQHADSCGRQVEPLHEVDRHAQDVEQDGAMVSACEKIATTSFGWRSWRSSSAATVRAAHSIRSSGRTRHPGARCRAASAGQWPGRRSGGSSSRRSPPHEARFQPNGKATGIGHRLRCSRVRSSGLV